MMALGSVPETRASVWDLVPYLLALQIPGVASCGMDGVCGMDDGAEGGGRTHTGVCEFEPRHFAWKVTRVRVTTSPSYLLQPSKLKQ